MIVEARGAVETLLNDAGFNVSAFVPERITPPVAVMEPSSDWVVSGDVFGAYRIGFDVTLITRTASNAKVTDEIDQMLDELIVAVSSAAGFYCGSAGKPFDMNVNGADYYAVSVTIYQNTSL